MITKAARQNLLKIAKAYASATGAALPSVSRKFYGKSTFLEDFKRGECCISVSRLNEMLQKFSNEWPDGIDWPTTAPLRMDRPAPRK